MKTAALLIVLAFIAGWWLHALYVRARQRAADEAGQRRMATLMDRADRLAGEKVMLLNKLEKHGEDLVEIKQQLLARERALYAITGTWPVPPPKPGDR